MRGSNVKQAPARNIGLRVISLLVAIGLWLLVNAGQRDAEVSLQIPVAYRGLPANLMIVNAHPEFVNLVVSGPSTLLSLLDPDRLTLRLDLAGVTPGEADFNIGPDRFSVPHQTRIERISPAQIRLDIDQLASRELPVHLSVTGRAARGYTISAVDVKPSTVTVTGPGRDVSRLQKLETVPFDVNGASEDVSRQVSLINPGGLLRLSTGQVVATVRLQEVVADRRFRELEIRVRDAAQEYGIEPHRAEVTVRGPASKLSTLKLDGAVYVDAQGAGTGLNELPVKVDLPEGIALVRQTPLKVKLRLMAKGPNRSVGKRSDGKR